MRVGEVVGFRDTVEGTRAAVLSREGPRESFGFLDPGGREVAVPADELLWGKPRTIGTTHVVLPRRAPGERVAGEGS